MRDALGQNSAMTKKAAATSRAGGVTDGALRLVCEVLLGGTLASAFVTQLIFSGDIHWTARFFGWQVRLNREFLRPYGNYLGENLAFCTWVAGLTILLTLALHVLSRATLVARIVRTVSVVAAVAVPPACLFVLARYRASELQPLPARLSLEASAAILFALLCSWSRRAIPLAVTAAVLALHCAFWFNCYRTLLGPFALCWKSVPAIGYVSAVASYYYTGRYRFQRGTQLPAAPETGTV